MSSRKRGPVGSANPDQSPSSATTLYVGSARHRSTSPTVGAQETRPINTHSVNRNGSAGSSTHGLIGAVVSIHVNRAVNRHTPAWNRNHEGRAARSTENRDRRANSESPLASHGNRLGWRVVSGTSAQSVPLSPMPSSTHARARAGTIRRVVSGSISIAFTRHQSVHVEVTRDVQGHRSADDQCSSSGNID
jgi:hypothetical protein